MITTEDIFGDIIHITFKDKDRYSHLGIAGDSHFMVLGYDNIGIWVKHPNLEVAITVDGNGTPLKTNDIIHEKINANFLITWDNIKTIMHYPNREGFDFPSEFNKNYGFKLKK